MKEHRWGPWTRLPMGIEVRACIDCWLEHMILHAGEYRAATVERVGGAVWHREVGDGSREEPAKS